MKTAKQAVQLWTDRMDQRTQIRKGFASKTNPGVIYEARVMFRGTITQPNWDCTCPKFLFSKTCRHVEQLWNGMSGFLRASTVHHDEIYERRNPNRSHS